MGGCEPTISVVVPAYNAERWISGTLESVLEQTDQPDEVVVVDDGSNDSTAEIVRRFGTRVRLVQQPNGGAPAAYNRGFAEARGDYVAMCPADDLWRPHKVAWQRAALTAHPEIDVAFGHARQFGLINEEYDRPDGCGILDADMFLPAMYTVDLIPAPAAVVRRALHTRLGRFREDLLSEDYEFWMRALAAGALFYYDKRCMVDYRRHGENISSRQVEIRELDYLIHKTYAGLVDPRLAEQVLSDDLRQLGRYHLDAGRSRAAYRAYRSSLRHRRSAKVLIAVAALRLRPLERPLRVLDNFRPARRGT